MRDAGCKIQVAGCDASSKPNHFRNTTRLPKNRAENAEWEFRLRAARQREPLDTGLKFEAQRTIGSYAKRNT